MYVLVVSLAAALLLIAAHLIFRRVGRDYERQGRLTPFSSFLEVVIFALHGMASYLFLDSDLGHVRPGSPVIILAITAMVVGLALLAMAMGGLGMKRSVGQEVTALKQSGLYRWSRNPQIVAYGLFVIGYALLWPSWSGAVWVILYWLIGHMMVRTEEAHLNQVYGQAYAIYCSRTPRYIGLPNPAKRPGHLDAE
jgi:protein-S-isoprenylcysteine O-methyltransferase Ste14